MAIDYRLVDELKRKSDARNLPGVDRPTTSGGSGGEPPDGKGNEPRVSALEASVVSIDKTLAVMSEQLKHVASREELAIVSAKLDGKASATDLAELKGRVARIPTVPVLVSVGILISLLVAAASWLLRHLPPAWTAALN